MHRRIAFLHEHSRNIPSTPNDPGPQNLTRDLLVYMNSPRLHRLLKSLAVGLSTLSHHATNLMSRSELLICDRRWADVIVIRTMLEGYFYLPLCLRIGCG